MMKKNKSIIIMVVLVIVAAGAYFFLQSTDTPAQTGLLFQLGDKETITRIALQNEFGSFDFTAEPDDRWTVTTDASYRANPEKMRLMVAALRTLPVSRVMEDHLPEYGLNPPVAQVTFTTQGGEKRSFAVGAETAGRSDVYILDEATGKVMITSTASVAQLTGSLAAYRDKAVLTVDKNNIRHIAYFEGSVPVLSLSSDGQTGDWVMAAPYEVPARQVEVNDLLAAIRGWTVAGYPADGDKDYTAMGLQKAGQALEITDADGNRQRLEFGAVDGTNIFVRTGGQDEIVKLYAVDVDFSRLTPEQMMFIAPLKTEAQALASISITAEGKQYLFALDHTVDPPTARLNGKDIAYSAFTSVFYKYLAIIAEGRDTGYSGTDAPVAVLTSQLVDGGQVTVELLPRDDKTLFMRIDGKTEYYLSASQLDALLYKLGELE